MKLAALLPRALRQFHREPLYAFASAGTLALAVAAAVTSFAVVKPALLDPLPYRGGDQLRRILTEVSGSTSAVSRAHVLQDLEAAAPPLSEFASVRPAAGPFVGDATTLTVPANVVTPSYLSLLGATPMMGRLLHGWRACRPGDQHYWQSTLSGDPNVVGRRVRFDRQERTIVGVMAADFFPPYFTTADAWLPLDMPALLKDPARARRTLTISRRAVRRRNPR